MVKPTDFLKKQHRLVEELFSQIERARRPEKQQALLHELAENLLIHMILEEEIVYPRARRALGDDVEIIESTEEHLMARTALERVIAARPGSDEFSARLHVVKELIMAHVKHEERELFPALNKAFDDDTQDQIMERIELLHAQAQKMDIVLETFGARRGRRPEAHR